MEILIGKGEDCHYIIPSDIVSHHHCRLIREEDRYGLIDLGSTNGTFVRKSRIPSHTVVPLAADEEVLISGSILLDWNVVRQLFEQIRGTRGVSKEKARRKTRSLPQASPNHTLPLQDARRSPVPPAAPPHPPPQPRYSPPPASPPQGGAERERAQDRAQPARDLSLRNDLVYAAHAHKSFTGKAFFTLVLYYLGFWIGGVIANFLFLGEAKRARDVTGVNPSGMGCLTFLVFTHFYIPLFLIFILIILLITGLSRIGDIFQGFSF